MSTSSASLSASSAGRSCSPSDAAERALRTLAVHSTLFRRRADTRASRGQYFGSECARPLFLRGRACSSACLCAQVCGPVRQGHPRASHRRPRPSPRPAKPTCSGIQHLCHKSEARGARAAQAQPQPAADGPSTRAEVAWGPVATPSRPRPERGRRPRRRDRPTHAERLGARQKGRGTPPKLHPTSAHAQRAAACCWRDAKAAHCFSPCGFMPRFLPPGRTTALTKRRV